MRVGCCHAYFYPVPGITIVDRLASLSNNQICALKRNAPTNNLGASIWINNRDTQIHHSNIGESNNDYHTFPEGEYVMLNIIFHGETYNVRT